LDFFSLQHRQTRSQGKIENTTLKEISMSSPLTIQIPPELEVQITRRAAQLNISPETFVLQSLQQAIQEEENEYEDEPKEAILASLRTALQEVKDGKVHPIEELWDGIDD
jgi:DNA-directed RNA polymerase subunit K/omega